MTYQCRTTILRGMLVLLVCLGLLPVAWGQQSQGSINVTVLDPSGSVISGAQLKLVDVATNDAREATTLDAGNYKFVNLNFGSYKLTVSKGGFETHTYHVVVQAARNTDVQATLKIGSEAMVVDVEGGVAPLIETSSNATNMTIDTKAIEDLPLGGRNIAQLSRLSAGYNGTWNGLPTMAQGNTIDGIVGNTSRWRYSGGADVAGVTPRLENIAEMTVSTDQLDLNQGWGNSNMQITYVTRRGSNEYHGRVYEDHRNSALNAHNWNSASKPHMILNEFGGSVGGPIVKDKLFFFGSFSMSKQPGGFKAQNRIFTSDAQQGIFKFGNGQQVNLFTLAAAYNNANETNLPTTRLSVVADRLSQINGYVPKGMIDTTATTDPNIQALYWYQTNPVTYYYPTFRLDYNLSQKVKLNLAYNQTKMNSPGANAGWFPGDGLAADNKSNAVTASLGVDWTISPTLVNQFKAGYLYTAAWYGVNGPTSYRNGYQLTWGYPTDMDWNIWDNYAMSGMYYNLPNSRLQPVISLSDTMTWVKGKHMYSFGFNAYRDQNKYWDPPEGYPNYNLGLAVGDPALQAITTSSLTVDGVAPTSTELARAQQLYAILAGRISNISGRHAYDTSTGQYATGTSSSTLNELLKSWGLFFQDSYKIKPNLTLNYGLRWDFVSPDKDLTGKYHTLSPADLFGPSGVGNLFQPGTLTGTSDPVYRATQSAYGSWNVTPQPSFGLAWTPRSEDNFFNKLLGGDKTVIRAGYSLRRFTEPQQFVWDVGSSYAYSFYQSFSAKPSSSGASGTFVPGSLAWGNNFGGTYLFSPAQYDKVIPLSGATFSGDAAAGLNPKIRQPYTQSWNLGIQRDLGASRVIEFRYNGSRTIHQWIAQNINEVNIFENGFLNEFKHAQANLAINGGTSFAPGAAGTYALPIMTAAGVSFTDAGFIQNLQNGQAGSFAGTLAGTRDYFCNMVGSTFSPCGTSYGAGAGYPINFWMANPYAIGSWTGAAYMTDIGFSNYSALQVELRQKAWHGVSATANYTWSHTLGVATAGDWMGGYKQGTIRDLKSSYGPANTDRLNVIHLNVTYDLPFGRGKQFLNRGGIVDKVLGGWTASSILTLQSGAPFRLTGANSTYNDLAPGGVTLTGITAADLQKHVGLFHNSSNQVRYLDPTWVSNMLTNGSISSNTTPGTLGQTIFLHGPHQTFTDLGISKSASITERIRLKFQMEMLNAFNHPVFTYSGTSVDDSAGFGSATLDRAYRPRNIEFRANIEF